MYIAIQDDQGSDIWQTSFDYVEGDDNELIKELLKAMKKLERMGILKVDE